MRSNEAFEGVDGVTSVESHRVVGRARIVVRDVAAEDDRPKGLIGHWVTAKVNCNGEGFAGQQEKTEKKVSELHF